MESWLPIFFIAFAVATVVGPIFMLQPSARQRRLVGLREKARKLGLHVHMLPLPGSPKPLPAYCKAWTDKEADKQAWLLERTNYAHEVNFDGVWDWADKLEAAPKWHQLLHEVVAAVPEGVVAIGNGPQGVCCYWRESGGEAVLEQLVQSLERLHRLGQPSA